MSTLISLAAFFEKWFFLLAATEGLQASCQAMIYELLEVLQGL